MYDNSKLDLSLIFRSCMIFQLYLMLITKSFYISDHRNNESEIKEKDLVANRFHFRLPRKTDKLKYNDSIDAIT